MRIAISANRTFHTHGRIKLMQALLSDLVPKTITEIHTPHDSGPLHDDLHAVCGLLLCQPPKVKRSLTIANDTDALFIFTDGPIVTGSMLCTLRHEYHARLKPVYIAQLQVSTAQPKPLAKI